jgi:hypothetical protein
VDDDAGTGRWMTYDELAAVRGIKRIGAVRLVQRHKCGERRVTTGTLGYWCPMTPETGASHRCPYRCLSCRCRYQCRH